MLLLPIITPEPIDSKLVPPIIESLKLASILTADKEIVEDNHPIIIISAVDIVEILKKSGIKTSKDVKLWLNNNFILKE